MGFREKAQPQGSELVVVESPRHVLGGPGLAQGGTCDGRPSQVVMIEVCAAREAEQHLLAGWVVAPIPLYCRFGAYLVKGSHDSLPTGSTVVSARSMSDPFLKAALPL